MGAVRNVFRKEVMDNFRDRRTLMSALLLGPVFGPILFAFVINLSLKQTLSNEAEALQVPVIGEQHAPNLITFLESRNIQIIEAPAGRDAAIDSVSNGEHDVVIVIPEGFGDELADTIPARIEVISDQANTQAERESRRAMRALAEYNQQRFRYYLRLSSTCR